jgi:hypothetical protein
MSIRLGDMMRDLRNPDLSRQRLDEIVRVLNEFGDREEGYRKWLRVQDRRISPSNLDLPLAVLYSTVLESNAASIKIDPLPTNFRNLMIWGSGSITSANGGNIWAQFNGDTGNNYSWQFVKADNATISGNQDTADPYAVLGVFGTTGAGAGVNGSFMAVIPNYTSQAWKKNVMSQIYTAEFNDLYLAGSTWANTSPITAIEIFGTDNTLVKGTTSLAAGSLITIMGML